MTEQDTTPETDREPTADAEISADPDDEDEFDIPTPGGLRGMV